MKNNLWTVLATVLLATAARGFEVRFDGSGAHEQSTPVAAPAPTVAPIRCVVAWPVVDVRREPRGTSVDAAQTRPYDVDPLQETQLLYGETVNAYETREGWVRIEALEQEEFSHNERWQGYPGWIPSASLDPAPQSYEPNGLVTSRYGTLYKKKSRWAKPALVLPLGSRFYIAYRQGPWARMAGLRGESGWMRTRDVSTVNELPQNTRDARLEILRVAGLFLGEPYYWGGRAGHRAKDKTVPSGVDCSGLVNLSYRAAGWWIPRDAHEQFKRAKTVKSTAELRPGDLVFLAKSDRPDKIVHVMIYEKRESLLEAVHDADRVRRVSFRKKLGRDGAGLQNGAVVDGFVLFLGRLLPE